MELSGHEGGNSSNSTKLKVPYSSEETGKTTTREVSTP